LPPAKHARTALPAPVPAPVPAAAAAAELDGLIRQVEVVNLTGEEEDE
jgi:hypothetical protein